MTRYNDSEVPARLNAEPWQIEVIEQHELPAVRDFLQRATARNAERFSKFGRIA